MYNSLFSRLLLVFALLIAQMGGLTHGISHALDGSAQSPEQSLPHHKHCDLCAAYGQIGSAIGSSSIAFACGENFETLHLSDSRSFISNTFAAFAARAPPCSA